MALYGYHQSSGRRNSGENVIHGRTVRGEGERRAPADPTYRSYHAMKGRCLNKNHSRYESYGGRGISVCERWLNGDGVKSGFDCFLQDMGERPSELHSIGRKNNDLNYEPSNCAWETDKDQKRNTSATRWVFINDEKMSLAEAVERFSPVDYATVRMRMQRGWDDVRAIITPKRM